MISPMTTTTQALALSLDLVAPSCALLALADVVIMLFNGITGSSFALQVGSTARTAVWLEAAFWAYSHFQTDKGRQLRPIDVEARKRFWRETMATLDNAASVDTWLCSWFDRKPPPTSLRDRASAWISGSMDESEGKVTMAEVKRGNIEEWLSGFFIHKPIAQVLSDAPSHHLLQAMVLALEAKRNFRLQTGYNPALEPIAPAVETVRTTHKPLAFYLAAAVVSSVVDCLLWTAGFEYYPPSSGQALGYFYHPGLSSPSAGLLCYLASKKQKAEVQTPIILVHGLGGYAPLTGLILGLLSTNRPIFLVDQPHISLKLTFAKSRPVTPSMAQMVTSVNYMLTRHSFPPTLHQSRGTIVAHSLGSSLASGLKASAGMATFDTVLIDPISMRMSESNLIRSVTRTRATSAFSALLRYVSTERGVAYYLFREFDYFNAALPVRTAPGDGSVKVILARKDGLVPVSNIEIDCKMANIDCEVFENVDHGGFLSSLPLFQRVIEVITTEPSTAVCQEILEVEDENLNEVVVSDKADEVNHLFVNTTPFSVPLITKTMSRTFSKTTYVPPKPLHLEVSEYPSPLHLDQDALPGCEDMDAGPRFRAESTLQCPVTA